MGVCFSYSWNNNNITNQKNERLAAARVIWKSGEVREYAVAVTVEEVLSDHKKSNNIGEDEDYFVCNSDSLYFDQLIPALNSGHQLSPNDIYFVLEASQRHRPLSAADMASLALKATAALDIGKKKKKNRFSRVSPQQQPDIDNYFFSHPPPDYDSDRTIGKARGGGANNNNNKLPRSSSSSMKKLQRLTSRRAKLAVRSFRLRLSTIYEST